MDGLPGFKVINSTRAHVGSVSWEVSDTLMRIIAKILLIKYHGYDYAGFLIRKVGFSLLGPTDLFCNVLRPQVWAERAIVISIFG